MQIPSKHAGYTRDGIRRAYLGGGDSSPKFTPTTTDTTSTVTQGPTYTSGTSSTTTQNKIPSWLEGTSQAMVQRAQNLSQTPYVPYEGQRIAEFAPMMEEAFGRIGSQGVAGQVGAATGLAQQAGLAGLSAGQFAPYQTGQFTGETAQQYMSPYMQSVLDTQMREAQRQADIATTTRAGAATRAGAFGGSRQAIMDAEAQRNLALQKGDIQAAGMQQAFTAAQQQFNTEQALAEQARRYGADLGIQGSGQALQAAQALGQLGQTQFGQEMDITQGLGYAGALQQQQRQAELDVAYQDFLARQKYPYEQIAFLQGITAGAPHSTTQISNTRTSGVTTPGAQTTTGIASQFETGKEPGTNITSNAVNVSQATGIPGGQSMLAQGGIVGYAEGGITGLLSDQELRKRQQDNTGTVSALAKIIVAQEQADRRAVRQAAMAQAAQMQGQRPTVAEEAMAGLDTLPVPDDLVAADGGVMALAGGGAVQRYQEGGGTYVPFYEQAYRQGEDKGSIYDPDFGLSAEERAARKAERDREDARAWWEKENARIINASVEGPESDAALKKGLGAAAQVYADKNRQLFQTLNYNEDAERAKQRYAAEQKAAQDAADLKAANIRTELNAANQATDAAAKGLPQLTQRIAPPAPAPKPDLRDRQGVNRTDTTQTDRALGATPEARAMGAQGAAQAGERPAAGGLTTLADLQKSRDAQVKAIGDMLTESAQAEATDATTAVEEFNKRMQDQMKSDEPARERISKREKDLEEKEKNAVWFNVLRGAIAAFSGRDRNALVNLARGASVGLEGFAADTAKIDESREKLRAEMDKLDSVRSQLQSAAGKDRAVLLAEERKAKRGVLTAGRMWTAENGLKLTDAQITQMTAALAKAQDREQALEDRKELARFEARLRPQPERVAKIDPVTLKRIEGVDAQIRAANSTIEKIVSSPYASKMQSQLEAAQDELATLQSARDKLLGGSGTPAPKDNGGAQPVVDLGKWQR